MEIQRIIKLWCSYLMPTILLPSYRSQLCDCGCVTVCVCVCVCVCVSLSLSLSLSLSYTHTHTHPSLSLALFDTYAHMHTPNYSVSLNNLTRLVLSHNKIAILPPEIVELRNLEYLNLFNNHLEVHHCTVNVVRQIHVLGHTN